MTFIEILILSFIEGLTEFIPVSSTAHIIIAQKLMGLPTSDFSKAFDVIIQFGAIAAVLVIYSKNFKFNLDFYKKLFIGFLPAAVIGFLFKNRVSDWMDNENLICSALIIGGIIMIWTDQFFKKRPIQNSLIDTQKSFYIGLSQCLALIPGVSRSAATIISGQFLGLDKTKAAEFSFFLAVPTLTAATLYKSWKIKELINIENAIDLSLGVLLSFVFALIAIKFFINIVKKYGFTWFGIYRIVIGIILFFIFNKSI